jgi:hypothetical protein
MMRPFSLDILFLFKRNILRGFLPPSFYESEGFMNLDYLFAAFWLTVLMIAIMPMAITERRKNV